MSDGGPAFPRAATLDGGQVYNGAQIGMTLLQYYAGCALQGICANANVGWKDVAGQPGALARQAHEIARHMLIIQDMHK